MHLHPAFFHQVLETEINAAQSDAQLFGQLALTGFGRLMQTAQDFQLDFLLETSQFL
jgi:hypothetical protein